MTGRFKEMIIVVVHTDGRRVRRGAVAAALGLAFVVAGPAATALADPPQALPAKSTEGDAKWQPAIDFDTDSCYNTPAIGPDGAINGGLSVKGTESLTKDCRDQADLDTTNAYVRTECRDGWCGYMYAYYFEKDKAVKVIDAIGHRHDWEHVVVWVKNDVAKYVSVSAHGGFETRPVAETRTDGTHVKVVYHKDGGFTHAMRFANDDDEPPENASGQWRYPALVSWGAMNRDLRITLAGADFGKAALDLKTGRFDDKLAKSAGETKDASIPW